MNNTGIPSRGELLDWLNTLLGTNYRKPEETCNGAAYCQVFDALYPGSIKLSNVNFNAITEPEMIYNYKILQDAFSKLHISKPIDVETIIKGRCAASLEMLQWVKHYFDMNYTGGEYDGPGRRAQCKCKEPGAKGRTGSSTKRQTSTKTTQRVTINVPKSTQPTKPKTTIKSNPAPTPAPRAKPTLRSNAKPALTPARTTSSSVEIKQLKAKLEELKKDNQILVEERTFYYEKLQKVEVICQDNEDSELANQILNILYETDEEHGFVAPDELDI
ncbi:microtubule-associated protein RP/EB family member 3-like isoform X1 [Histomonas meleagridis]|uniref:microtubule-associated protein RP/EB family member 3-like isoform X1 n=1 Tax=Histomonas meleagridis TaxID=135588 RepID=UPI0035599014|nr:microtubule-associated protein RP/EB family member 3-like isoform X1 [Histomonas meleagridis]KAH0797914.1 microtubule-associated protein RP/EB family member 3-like isoform X1 [Histomonas meleagridis]